MRHYFPFVREKGKKLLKNRDYFYNKLYNIIKERRVEVENTPLDQPLRHDMLTSFITANTSRDINPVKNADAEYLRPMTDKEIFGNVLDAITAGTNTVNKILFYFVYALHVSKFISFLKILYRRRICFALLYIISDNILK